MRKTELFNDNWIFQLEGKDCETVKLPHTWNAVDGQDGGDDYFRGIGTYKKMFVKPKLGEGQRLYVEFRGVNSSSEVKINGKSAATHDGGYSTFRVDVTDELEDENVLEVIADNRANDHVYPQRADFTFYGGIYRDAYLVTVDAAHFDLDYYGGNGLKITPSVNGVAGAVRDAADNVPLSNATAEVKLEAYVTGKADSVTFTIPGAGTVSAPVTYGFDGADTADGAVCGYAAANITIENVHLWDGLDDPYCYDAKAELVVSGQVTDTVDSYFGCRTYYVDPEKGFFLNGRSYPLHGVSRHQDRRGVGNALTKEMHAEDIDMILSMGTNAIRLAHYQHDQYFYELCDREGLVAWAEIPYISMHLPNARENTISQMRELITQNYNHPCIICWALSNEISLTGVTDDLMENHVILNDLAHEMDPTRLTTMANLFMLEIDSPLVDVPDIRSYNLYYGWYVGELEQNDEFFDEFHAKYPDKAIGLSEYGADTHYTIQSPNPVKGDYSEQYQALYHEHMLEMFSTRPYLWSTFVWNMFDFAADAREEAGDNGVNHKGLISFDRKVKKDAFYIYKAWWSKEPFVHVCGSRYVDRVEDETEIKVYTNQPKVALYVNGSLVEEQEGNHVFTFKISNVGEQAVEAKAGDLSDRISIRKVDTPNPAYAFKEQTSVKNWFEEEGMEIIPGYYSIKDTLGDICKSPEGAAFVEQMQAQMAKNSSMASMAEGVVMTDQIKKMMARFTVENLLKQAGGDPDPQMVVAINKQLSKIKKVD